MVKELRVMYFVSFQVLRLVMTATRETTNFAFQNH